MGETASEARFRSGGLTVGGPSPSDLLQAVPRQVFVTGAGFTRAFVLDAPLLVDDFDNDGLVEKVRSLPKASRLLESERNQHRQGFIDIERLMTRLDELMPYDYSDHAVDEFAFLLAELKRAFLARLSRARQSEVAKNDIAAFASHCAATNATCITFNYDDFLDESLWATGDWNPHWGYGFFCRSSLDAVSTYGNAPEASTLLLLKLHGSVNWWPRLGYSQPFVLDAITHRHGWEGVDRHAYPHSLVARHLEAEPVIVPPVLSKSGLVAQPVLRLVWALAFESLATADEVTFVGYSFPPTDMAARTLFSEALRDLPRDGIGIVGLAEEQADRDSLKSRYRSVLGDIPDHRFLFDGAVEWTRSFADDRRVREAPSPSACPRTTT